MKGSARHRLSRPVAGCFYQQQTHWSFAPLKLSFLGQSYEATVTPIEAMATSETATFLGQQYSRKHVTAALRQPAAELTDRGVRYSR